MQKSLGVDFRVHIEGRIEESNLTLTLLCHNKAQVGDCYSSEINVIF